MNYIKEYIYSIIRYPFSIQYSIILYRGSENEKYNIFSIQDKVNNIIIIYKFILIIISHNHILVIMKHNIT